MSRPTHVQVDAAMCRSRNDTTTLRADVDILTAEVMAMRAAIDHLESEVERAAEHLANKDKGGMRVPFFGDFAQVPPSGLTHIRWHVRNIRGGK